MKRPVLENLPCNMVDYINHIEAKLERIEAALPDDFSPSKDWKFDSDPVSRIEWLKFFVEQSRKENENDQI